MKKGGEKKEYGKGSKMSTLVKHMEWRKGRGKKGGVERKTGAGRRKRGDEIKWETRKGMRRGSQEAKEGEERKNIHRKGSKVST
jgi:hypothetical protein